MLDDSSFFQALSVSLAVTLLTVVAAIAIAFLGALAVSRCWRGRKSFILALLLIQMLPAEGLFIAQYKMMSLLGLLNQVLGLAILYTAAVVPFTIWMLRGFVAGVPIDLEEAAMVDGLSRTQAFLRITFPLLAPGLVASAVYAFLQAWNEFTVALVVMTEEQARTLPLWLRGFLQASAMRETDWGQVMAASTLVAIPVIAFFLMVQSRLSSGLVGGAVKGLMVLDPGCEDASCSARSCRVSRAPPFRRGFMRRMPLGSLPSASTVPTWLGHRALSSLCASLRAERPDVLIAVDEEGGDVTRVHYLEGSPEPGNAVLGRLDDTRLTRDSAARVGRELRGMHQPRPRPGGGRQLGRREPGHRHAVVRRLAAGRRGTRRRGWRDCRRWACCGLRQALPGPR